MGDDQRKNSDLVRTLSTYLETGGNYHDAAAAMHIHRSTLRYRLARIRELTGLNMRDVNTRFNLHAPLGAGQVARRTRSTGVPEYRSQHHMRLRVAWRRASYPPRKYESAWGVDR
jgi:hypothetical protein